MKKPNTLKALKQILKELERDKTDFVYKHIEEPSMEFRRNLFSTNKTFIKAYDEKILQVRKDVNEKEEELKAKNDTIPEALKKWLRYYQTGVNFGYNGLTLRYIHRDRLFVIVSSNGGTAGTGTAMGTGGYYYSESEHFVVFPQYQTYMDSKMPHSTNGRSTNAMFTVGGRMTNAVRDELIKKGEEYVKKYNVQPFTLEEVAAKKI